MRLPQPLEPQVCFLGPVDLPQVRPVAFKVKALRTVLLLLCFDSLVALALLHVFTSHMPLARLGMPSQSAWLTLSALALRGLGNIYGAGAALFRSVNHVQSRSLTSASR